MPGREGQEEEADKPDGDPVTMPGREGQEEEADKP
jgi:hypothetical protein